MRSARRAWAVTVLVSVSAAAQQGDRLTAHLDWTQSPGGTECIDRAALERAVNERWGREVFLPNGDADVFVKGRIGPDGRGKGWRAVVELRTKDGMDLGSRELTTEAPHCSALDDSVALAVGLMLDVSKQRLAEEAAAAKPETPASPEAAPEPIELPSDTLAPREPWEFDVSVGGVAAWGLVPGMGLGLQAGVTLTPPNFFVIELTGTLWREAETRRGNAGSTFDLWTTSLAVCPLAAETLELTACGIQRFGLVSSTGFGFDQNQNQSDVVLDVGVRGRASLVRFGAFGLRLGVSAEVPILGYHFVFVDSLGRERVLYEMSPVVISADLALVLYF